MMFLVESHAHSQALCKWKSAAQSADCTQTMSAQPQLCRGSPTTPVNSGYLTRVQTTLVCKTRRSQVNMCNHHLLSKSALPGRVLAGDSSPVFLDNVRMFRRRIHAVGNKLVNLAQPFYYGIQQISCTDRSHCHPYQNFIPFVIWYSARDR